MKTSQVPEAAVARLSVYSRFLEGLERDGATTISSEGIASGVGVNSTQVRKDLAYFGEFGVRGLGYNVKELLQYIYEDPGFE